MPKKKNKVYELTLGDKIGMIKMSVRAITRGYKTSRLITGTAGIGKSHAVIEELEEEGVQYTHLSGGIKNVGAFYTLLCDNNAKDMVVVLDDINVVLKDADCIELLRVACTNEPIRRITYGDNKLVKGRRFYKPSTDFYSRIIIITNRPMKKIDPAIISRTSPIEIIATIPEVFEWVGMNLPEAPPHEMPKFWKEEVYNFIQNDLGTKDLKRFDFRLFEDAMLWYGSCIKKDGIDDRGDKKIKVDDSWKSYVYTLLCN